MGVLIRLTLPLVLGTGVGLEFGDSSEPKGRFSAQAESLNASLLVKPLKALVDGMWKLPSIMWKKEFLSILGFSRVPNPAKLVGWIVLA